MKDSVKAKARDGWAGLVQETMNNEHSVGPPNPLVVSYLIFCSSRSLRFWDPFHVRPRGKWQQFDPPSRVSLRASAAMPRRMRSMVSWLTFPSLQCVPVRTHHHANKKKVEKATLFTLAARAFSLPCSVADPSPYTPCKPTTRNYSRASEPSERPSPSPFIPLNVPSKAQSDIEQARDQYSSSSVKSSHMYTPPAR